MKRCPECKGEEFAARKVVRSTVDVKDNGEGSPLILREGNICSHWESYFVCLDADCTYRAEGWQDIPDMEGE